MSIVLVDKPGGMTSHDVVARARRAFGTKKIGHAGTLDPMATGLLVLGVGPATRLLTYLVGLGKTYEATVRLGRSTTTDDAEGESVERADADVLAAVDDDAIAAGVARLTGRIAQVPSSVSAIKVDGRRAYDRVRAGEDVALAAREVDVDRFEVTATRRERDAIDLDVVIDCSSGTYIRALARDLGGQLRVGGHLTALRRTRVGPFNLSTAASLDDLADAVVLTPADAAAAVLPVLRVDDPEAAALRQGKRLVGAASALASTPAAAIDPAGRLIGIVERRGDDVTSVMNLAEGYA